MEHDSACNMDQAARLEAPGTQRSRTWLPEARDTVCARLSAAWLRRCAWAPQVFSEQNMEFMEKIIERSGLGDETGLSDGILAMREPSAALGTSLKAATEETQMVIFDVAGSLLMKANVRPDEARPPSSELGLHILCSSG